MTQRVARTGSVSARDGAYDPAHEGGWLSEKVHKRPGSITRGLLIAAHVLVLSSVITPVADAQTPLMVSVTYWQRSCHAPAALAQTAPVTAGMLQIRDRTGAAVTVTLGPKPIPLTGAIFPLTATLLLETPRVKVVSGASSSATVTIDLSTVVLNWTGGLTKR